MISIAQVNGADPAWFFEDMANGGEYYREVLTGIRDDVRGVQTEVAGLRSNLNQLGNQITRIEAFDLHGRLQTQTARIDALEKEKAEDRAKYQGQIQTLKYISNVAIFISVLVGLIVSIKGMK